MEIKKSWRLENDDSAIGPLLIMLLVGGLLIAGVSAYQVFSKPNITYNISDTGFSIAGVDVSWLLVIVIVGAIVLFIVYAGRKKSDGNR